MTNQIEITLNPFNRGIHLITNTIIKELQNLPKQGLLNIFIKHTSASITINENADPTVRTDFTKFIDKLIPDNTPYFEHTDEGLDDMPSHIKHSFIGSSITIPISNNKLNMGIWQGIYLCEFRNNASSRNLIITIHS